MSHRIGAMATTAVGRVHRYVAACEHVVVHREPILVVVHTSRVLILFCGPERHPPGQTSPWPMVFTDDVVRGDAVLENLHELPVGAVLSRRTVGAAWERGAILE